MISTFLLLWFALGSVSAQTIDLEFNFRHGDLGWTADFSGYPPATNESGFYQLDSGIRYAPRKLTRGPVRAYYIQGNNHSAGLMMFLKRRLTAAEGIVAGRTYRVEFLIKVASRAPVGCVGIGSSPGEGVRLRAGGTASEPVAILRPDGWLDVNFDLPTMTASAGNIANGLDCEAVFPTFPFVYIERTAMQPQVTASKNGQVWLFVATQSGFEGLTQLYYQNIKVRLIPV